jgi:beta-lactamase regulating signal transducer with metallopeptidase domain/polyhydroxyalkanoate synthesis regulator phasin
MNTIVEHINSAGHIFVEFALPMLIQSSVLIVILLLVDLLLRKKVKAVFRYWIWMLVLLKLILPTSLSSPLSLGYLFGDKLTYQDLAQSSATLEPTEPVPADISPGMDPLFIQPNPYFPPTEPVTPLSWQGVVFLVWLAVVIAMGLLLLQRAFFVRGLVAQAKKAGCLMNDALAYCSASMGIMSNVGLKVSVNATTPSVCGLVRPVILVPWNLTSTLGASRMRTILMHELAHIRRGDLWVNLAQTALQIIYFYNPLFWLANSVIRRIREQAVDEAVLVAMGEKARKYPQTLVDVAKMAFKRPALSLRLIGVVESKSALAGRIKHILGRPIPKTARLGIVGVLAVIIAGAILLPMAAGKDDEGASEDIAKASEFMATLPNDVTVELVGICEHPSEGKKWWRPDGSLLGQSPVRNIDVGGYNIRRGEAAYELVAKLNGPETLLSRSSTPEKWKVSQARKVGLGKSGTAKDKSGKSCLRATTAIVKNGLDKIDIEFGLAGVWEKRLTISSNESSKQKIRDTGIVINPPYEKDSNATITIKIPNKIDSKMAINITAVLKNGKVIDSAAWNRSSKIRFMRSTDNYEFHGVNLSDVDRFEIYTSKYQWVEFKDVSLKPNFKTDVQVSAQELVVKIIESERKIEDIQLHMTCTIPARNLVFYEYDWGYDSGKEFYAGFQNSTKPGRNEISRTTQITRAFDGQNEWSLRVSSEDKQPRGAIFKPSFSLRSTMTFNTLLGFEAKERSRLSFGEAIAQAESVSISDNVEFIDGHPCYVIEAVNLVTDPSVNWAYDVRAWVDYQRDYRLLKFEKCRSISGNNRFKVVSRRVDNIRLKQVDGIWLPVEGSSTTFSTNDYGPPKGMTLAQFVALPAEEQKQVGVFKLTPMAPPRRLEVDVKSIRLNKGIPPERFTVVFPDGCEVYNEFTGNRYVIGEPSEREAALSDAEWIERMAGLSVSELIVILRNSRVGNEKKKWFAAVHRLVEIGSAAVPEMVAELRQTEKPQTQSKLALTLRAIGDPNAVPGLIDGLERSGFSSDYGIGYPRTELDLFIQQHQMDPTKKDLGLGRPVREITIALEKLTGHTEGHDHFHAYDLKYDRLGSYTITPEIRDRQRQHRRQVAERWRKWWQANKDNIKPIETLPKPPAEPKPARSEKLERMIMAAPEGSILTLAIVPNMDGSGRRPSLTKEEYQRHVEDLARNGPFAGSVRGESFQWSPIKGDSTRFGDLPLSAYKDRNYLLLCARAQYVMMPELEGKWAWGLEKVETTRDGDGKPTISIQFDEKGSELLYELTRANIGNHLAIAVDSWVLSAPTVETTVRKEAVIAGDFTEEQARTFVEELRKGMTPVDQQTIKAMRLIAEAADKLNKQDVAKMRPRQVVENFLIAGLGGLNEKLRWFVRPDSAVDKILDNIDFSEELLDGYKIKVVNVYAGSKDAFAVTSDITDQYGEQIGQFMFYLSNESDNWLIYDLDAGKADKVRESLTEFLSTHPDVQIKTENNIQAPPLKDFERKLIEQVWPAGPGLYHVDAQGHVTVWHYQLLWQRSTDCAEDEVGWGSSQLASAKGMYYLPDGTPLQSRWRERGSGMRGMKDIRVKVGRTVGKDERVPVIHRHRLPSVHDLLSRDGRKRKIEFTSWEKLPVAIIVRIDKPVRLDSWWLGEAARIHHYEDYDQLFAMAPPVDYQPMYVFFICPEDEDHMLDDTAKTSLQPGMLIL